MSIRYGFGNGIRIISASDDLNVTSSITPLFTIRASEPKGNELQILIPSQSTGEDEDTVALFITSSGKNPFLGIGTQDPRSTLDIKDVEDSSLGTKFLLQSARSSSLGAQVGDSAGSIFFSIDSGSYNDPFTTGSITALKTIVTNLSTTGSGQSSLNSSGVFRIDASPVNDNGLYNIVQIGFFTGSHVNYQGQETGASATVHISGSLIIHPIPSDTGQQQGDIVPFEVWNRPAVSAYQETLQLYLTGSNLILTTGSFTANKITGSVEVVAGTLRLFGNSISNTLDGDVYLTISNGGIGFEANTGDSFSFHSVQNDVNFQIAGENDQNLFFGDASSDRIGIGTNTPNAKLDVVGSGIFTGSLNVSQSFTASGLYYPDIDGTDGQVITTDGAGNLSFQTIEDVYVTVKNVSGGTLYKGTPVHATSSVAAGNATPVIAASASNALTMPATFVLNEQIDDEAEGQALLSGFIQGVDTSIFEVGEVAYVGENGGFTNVKPTGSNNLIQNLGIVTKVHASNGSGWVYGSGRSNDVPNLPTGKIWVGSDSYTVTSSVISLDETNKYVSGSESAKFQIGTYAFGYNTFPGFGFDVTGSGIIVSSSLPSLHYPMVKIGETELLDLTTATALDHTFTIHNVDNFQVTSGSEPTDVSTNKLFEHIGDTFKVYSKGNSTPVFTASSSSIALQGVNVNILPSTGVPNIKIPNTSTTPQYVPVFDSDPSGTSGRELKYITASTFIGGGSSTPYSLGTFGGKYQWGTSDGGKTVAHGFVNGPTAGATQNTDHWIDSAVYTPDSTTYSMSTYKMQYAALYSPVGGIPHIKGWGRTSDSDFTTNHSMSISLWSLETEPANLAAGSQTLTLRAQSEFLTFNAGTINYLGNGWEASGSSARPAGTFYFVTWDLGGPNPSSTADLLANFTIWVEPS